MPTFTPVDHDPFAAPTPSSRTPRFIPVDHDPFAGTSARGVAMPSYDAMGNATGSNETVMANSQSDDVGGYLRDIAGGFGGGLVRGAAGTAGFVTDTLPWALSEGSKSLARVATFQSPDQFEASFRADAQRLSPALRNIARTVSSGLETGSLQKGIESVTGPAYEPHTRAGRFASTVGEFVPGSLIGPGNMVRNAMTFGVLPGLASEAGGQLFEGSAMETPARLAGGLAGGVGGMMASRGSAASGVLRKNMEGVSAQELDAAEALFQRAQQAGQPISRAEAVQAVTNGRTGMGDLQHTVEGMGGMKDFYAPRVAQNEAGARRAFDSMATRAPDPSSIGRQVGIAAENTLDDVRGAINRQTRPLYDAAEHQRIDPHTFAQVQRDPVFQEGLRRVREDPWIGPTLAGHPDDSVRVVHAIKTQLDETGRNLRDPIAGTARNNYASSIVQQGNQRLVRAADEATGSAPGVMGSYETARTQQAQLREQYLQPLLDGPIGKIANRDQTTKQAIEALFPANPLPGSAGEVATAVSAVAQRNPWAARQLVRTHAEMSFNEASQRLASGPNQSGGAKFAALIRGNSDQAANLEAAVTSLPNGDATWRGFNSFLELLEAQQFRQATGSRTAFKVPGVEDLKSGGLANNAAQIVASGGIKWPAKAVGAIQNWNVGRNLDELAGLLTDPAAAGAFRAIADAPRGSDKATALAARLAVIGVNGWQSSDGRPRVRRDGMGR